MSPGLLKLKKEKKIKIWKLNQKISQKYSK